MTLKDQMMLKPDVVQRKIKQYRENFCACIIAALADVTPEEAFLSLDRDKIFYFITRRNNKYGIDEIYNMLIMRDRGFTLKEIGEKYNINQSMVWRIMNAYDQKNMPINQLDIVLDPEINLKE